MANKKHVKILKQGVEVWNKWREENPEIKPDLSGQILRETNLKGADLSKANLLVVDFSLSDLSRASVSEADLRGAYLVKANLAQQQKDQKRY